MAAAGRSTRADGGTGLVARPRSVPGWSHGHPLRRAARQPDRQVRQGNFSIQVSTLPRPFQRNPSNTPGRPTEKPQKSAVTPDTTRRAQLAPPDRPTVQTFPAQSVQIAPDRARPTGTRISAPQNIHQALDRIGHGPTAGCEGDRGAESQKLASVQDLIAARAAPPIGQVAPES